MTQQSLEPSSGENHRSSRKLIILPSSQVSLGGTLFSPIMTIKGFSALGKGEQVCVLVQTGSLMANHLTEIGLQNHLVLIPGETKPEFISNAMKWVHNQPNDWPLLLENCVQRLDLWPLVLNSLSLRLQKRPTYLLFHDLATSYNLIGSIARKLTFMILGVKALCNSHFTSGHIQKKYGLTVQQVLYPPIDLDRFEPLRPNVQGDDIPTASNDDSLAALKPILATGKPILLTASRINKPGIVNDKNLRMIPAVLATLKQKGHDYYGVIVGQDKSPDLSYSKALYAIADTLDVRDRFEILPPSMQIETYYHHATALLTLAPREPFGRTVVEAIACGLPVIGSNSGGISEILNQIAPEWMVDPYDADAAADAILRLTNPPSDWPSVQDRLQQGRLWIETHCSVVNTAKALMEVVGLAA